MRAVGLMSGTSLDGIDAACLEIRPRGEGYAIELLRFLTVPFSEAVRERLRAALPPHAPALGEIAALDASLGAAFGEAVRTVAGDVAPDYVASHGLTLFHDGAAGASWQIGDPFAIRERAEATVAYDFRRADCAAGGQGAPLVPYVDALLFGGAERATVALNLGGIANVTVIPPGARRDDVRGWDTGPANMLLDAFVRARTGGTEAFDAGGAYARRGDVDAALLELMLADPYFTLSPPKSTGRERFGASFLYAHPALQALSLEDGCATLAALSAESIARDLRREVRGGARVVVSGGGARNAALLDALRERLGREFEIVTSDEAGVDPDAKEAVAFALLGYELLRGRPAGLPAVTGARRPALLGSLAPFELPKLLERVRVETGER
jgi:anhydro-N-acetylmuramic acid kinase